ncbi:MAG: hypothetical protein ABJP48_05545 [Erythrobacter sp.]
MVDYTKMSLPDARRDYLANSTTAMPIGGLIAWSLLAIALFAFSDHLPPWAPFVAAALPVPIALLIDKVRGTIGVWSQGNDNPIAKLFLQSIWIITLLIPLLFIAAQQSGDADLLVLGMGILAGVVWVPHGWGANDPAGFRHFLMRAVLCYAVYLFAPEPIRGAAIAAAVAAIYIYALIAMKKPQSARSAES